MSGLDLYACCLARSLAFCHSAPLLSDDEVPSRIRTGLAFLLAVLLAPLGVASALPLPLAMAGEAIYGWAVGFALAAFWRTLESGIAQLGLTLEPDEEPGPWATLSRIAGVCAFLTLGGDHHLISLLAAPARAGLGSQPFEGAVTQAATGLFLLSGASLLPLLGAAFLAHLMAALVQRGSPIDLGPVVRVAMITLAIALVAAWSAASPLLFQSAFDQGHRFARTVAEGRP